MNRKYLTQTSQHFAGIKTFLSSFLLFLFIIIGISSCHNQPDPKSLYDDKLWAPDVKQALTDFTKLNANKGRYVVFDFDNTTAIFDIEEQLFVYQLQTMSFAMNPETLHNAISAGLTKWDEAPYADYIADIDAAYQKLYENYGPFNPDGIDSTRIAQLQADPQWQEFSTKLIHFYDVISDYEGIEVSYAWCLYWTTGMTSQQVYDLARRSDAHYGQLETSAVTWTSPADLTSHVGQISHTWTSGVSVTSSLKELWKNLSQNGIDVWVCSASAIDQVRAAVDEFGLHDYCKGVIAMTVQKDSNQCFVPLYDYDTSYAQYALEDGKWELAQTCTHAMTGAEGKTVAIQNALVPLYNQGPIAGFCDSSGDFQFCTEFKSLQLVVCFNRANRKVTEGAGLMAEVAMYERDHLGFNLQHALDDGNTLYVLQGRDENGMRSLRTSNKTLRLGSAEEQLFANEENQKELDYFCQQNLSVSDIFNTFSIATPAEDSNNKLGFKYGWLKQYDGYHSK